MSTKCEPVGVIQHSNTPTRSLTLATSPLKGEESIPTIHLIPHNAASSSLPAAARARLTERARTATDQTAGRRVFAPEEMRSVGATRPAWQPVSIRELERSGDSAVVELRGPSGERATVRTIREGEDWFVELPSTAASVP